MNRRQRQIYDFLSAKNTWMSAKDIAESVFGEKWPDKLGDVSHGLRMLELAGHVEMHRIKVNGQPDKFEYRAIKDN